MKRYVQHISGQGEKWPLDENQPTSEEVYKVTCAKHCAVAYLPKSDYRICEPPAPKIEWRQLTNRYIHLDSVFDEQGNRIEGTFRVMPMLLEKKEPS